MFTISNPDSGLFFNMDISSLISVRELLHCAEEHMSACNIADTVEDIENEMLRCDRVTWCLGPFSLVITHISLSSLFLSSSVKNISISPPFVGSARTRKVHPSIVVMA